MWKSAYVGVYQLLNWNIELRNLYTLLNSLLRHLPHCLRNPPFVSMKPLSVQVQEVYTVQRANSEHI